MPAACSQVLVWFGDLTVSVHLWKEAEKSGCKASPECEPQGRTRSLLPLYRSPLHIEQNSGRQNVYPETQDPVEGKDGRGEPRAPTLPCPRDAMSGSRCPLWRGKH